MYNLTGTSTDCCFGLTGHLSGVGLVVMYTILAAATAARLARVAGSLRNPSAPSPDILSYIGLLEKENRKFIFKENGRFLLTIHFLLTYMYIIYIIYIYLKLLCNVHCCHI